MGPTSRKGREILESATTGHRTHLFARRLTSDEDFVYCGVVTPLEHALEKPMFVRFVLGAPLPEDVAMYLDAPL